MSEQQQPKRGPGRPRTGRKGRIDASVSRQVEAFLDAYGQTQNVSAYLERLIVASPEYQSWKAARP